MSSKPRPSTVQLTFQEYMESYVEDTSVIQKTEHRTQCSHYSSSIDPHIQFIGRESSIDGPIPFWTL